MPVPALADLPQSDSRAADARPTRASGSSRCSSEPAVAVAAVGLPHAVLGVLFGDPRAVALGAMAIAYAAWLGREVGRIEASGRSAVIARIADVSLVLVGIAAVLQPSIAAAMAIALLPPVLTPPFLDGHRVRRVLLLGGSSGSVLSSPVRSCPRPRRSLAHLTSARSAS